MQQSFHQGARNQCKLHAIPRKAALVLKKSKKLNLFDSGSVKNPDVTKITSRRESGLIPHESGRKQPALLSLIAD